MEKEILEKTIQKMEDYYAENGKTKSLDYAFGFFDAVAVLREMAERAIR